jgi:5-methylcytosine-specific restriction enzyme subunit McrC
MIPIQNVYYMLAYAFRTLQENGYQKVGMESFEHVLDLYTALLCKGTANQIKWGLSREYLPREESTGAPHGKILLSESLKRRSLLRKQLVCTYDEFSADAYLNRILKTTLTLLLKADISQKNRHNIHHLLPYFEGVTLLDARRIKWHRRYNRNNQTYRMLVGICYMVIHGLLQHQEEGNTKLITFSDDQAMSRLYEGFLRAYYKEEYPAARVSASEIKWDVEAGDTSLLPEMKSDVTIDAREKILILDAKYYQHMLQEHWKKKTVHSANLYQIYAYVRNKEAELRNEGRNAEVSGMLLYAQTDEGVVPDVKCKISGHWFRIRGLDLMCDFQGIKDQLDGIAEEILKIKKSGH